MSFVQARARVSLCLGTAGISNARQEADWILVHVLGARSSLDLHRDQARMLTPAQGARLARLVRRRAAGEPLQYVLGSCEFRGLELAVGPGVLIPRPETECLVDLALQHYPGHGAVCDVCTGSGAIALALASELPCRPPILGVDLCPVALRYARRNRRRLGLTNVRFRQGDLFGPVPTRHSFALITANPPYVSAVEYAALPAVVGEHEPRLALWAGEDGLALTRRLAAEARGRLSTGAWVICEIGQDQGPAARECFRTNGYRQVRIHRDYSQRDRFVAAQR